MKTDRIDGWNALNVVRRRCLCIALGAVATLGVAGTAAHAEDIVTGAEFPLSRPGTAYTGLRHHNGAELAVERVTASHMLEVGRALKLIINDNSKRAGLDRKVAMLAIPNADTPVFVKFGGKAVKGLYYPAIYNPQAQKPHNFSFVETCRKRTNGEPDGIGAYEGVMLLAAATREAEPGANRDKVTKALDHLHDQPTVLGISRYVFGDGPHPDDENVMVQAAGGAPVIYPLH